jgi:hypothetical protein
MQDSKSRNKREVRKPCVIPFLRNHMTKMVVCRLKSWRPGISIKGVDRVAKRQRFISLRSSHANQQGNRKVWMSGGSVKAEGLGDGPVHWKTTIAKLRLTLPPAT